MERSQIQALQRTGAALLLFGIAALLDAFLLQSEAATAVGLAGVMLAIVFLGLASQLPAAAPRLAGLVLDAALEQIEELAEEFGVNRGIYLPVARTDGRPRALLSLNPDEPEPSLPQRLPAAGAAAGKGRVLVPYGRAPAQVGLLVVPSGSKVGAMLESRPGPSAPELTSALSMLLVHTAALASAVEVICDESIVTVAVRRPRQVESVRVAHRVLGSLIASIAAGVTAESYDRPVIVREEVTHSHQLVIRLEVLP